MKGTTEAQTLSLVVYSAVPLSELTSPSEAVQSAVEAMFRAIALEFFRTQ